MKDLADTLHLRCRSGTWYYVRRVPKVLAPIIGKKFIKHSLNTKDKAQAKKLRPVEDMRADALFAAAENQLAQLSSPQVSIKTPSLDELVEYVRQVVAQTDRCSAESFVQNPPMDQAERHERKAEAGLDLTVYQVPGPEQDEAVSRATEKILNDVGVTLSDADLVSNFAEIVRRGMIELGRRKLDRYDDRYDRAFQDALFDPKRPSEISFGAAVDIFLTERFKDYQINGISQRRIDQVSARAGFICEIVGKNTALSEIDDDAVQRVRDLLSRTPSNMKKAYPNTSLSKAIERAEQDGKPVLSPTTQGAYLDILRDILKVAVRKRLIAYNPAEDVRPLKQQTLSTAERRLPWTEEQIVGFFTGKFYRSCAPNAPMPYKKPDRDWRFWLPLIMLLTGARPGEICQLRVGDIQKTDGGTWYMNLLNEDDQKSSKTFTSRRRVPLHPELLKIGFFRLVERRKNDKTSDPLLFSGLERDKYGDLSAYPCRRMREAFIPQEIVLSKRQAFYSLRHNVRDALRRIKAPPDALRHISGWSEGKNVSDDYGDPGNPDFYIDYVARISYPGLDLSFLYADSKA